MLNALGDLRGELGRVEAAEALLGDASRLQIKGGPDDLSVRPKEEGGR